MNRTDHHLAGGGSDEPPALVAAATVVLIADTPDGLETLTPHRSSKVAFGGTWVFPGGRVDPGDIDPERATDEQAAARNAAVREAEEEAGLVVSAGSLVPLSYWIPPPEAPRRFSTWFFLAPAPAGTVVVDGGEIHDHQWLRPADALARRDAGEIELVPPTWITLWYLAQMPDVAAALARADGEHPERFETRIGRTADAMVAMWEGDAGYATGDVEAAGTRHRLLMRPSGWAYEREPAR